MAVVELVYVSKSIKRMAQTDLEQLLVQARTFNAKNQITGLLLYDGYGTFVQALEGEERSVLKLYERIISDSRHQSVTRVGFHYIKDRSFPDWSMGFRTFDSETLPDTNGCLALLEQWESGAINDTGRSFAHKMIHHFAHTPQNAG